MYNKRIIAYRLFTLLAAVLIGIYIYILGSSIIKPYEYSKYEFSWIILILGLLVGSILLFIIYKKIKEANDKQLKIISIASLVIMAIIQTIFIYNIVAIPYMDLANVHSEALNMLDTGIITNEAYFGMYPTNIPITILLYNIFKVGDIVGIDNFRILGSIVNVLMIDIAIIIGYLCLVQVRDRKQGTLYLILCMLNPVFYTYAPYYYTDTMSIFFLITAIYMYVLAKRSNREWKSILYYLSIGIILVIGIKIRATTVIVGVAILIYKILTTEIKQVIKSIFIIIIGGVLTIGIYNNIENRYVKFDYSDSSYPITHWLMMSHQGEGGWKEEDVKFTGSFKTKEEKIEQNLIELEKRIEDLGLKGYIELVGKKIQRVWASGTHRYEQYLTKVEEYTGLYNYILGSRNILFTYYNQIIHVILIFFILIGMAKNIKNKNFDELYITKIALFGAILFYAILWETHPKYSVCFVLLMIIASIDGHNYWDEINEKLRSIIEICIKAKGNREYILSRKKFIKGIFNFRKIVLFITLIICVINYREHTDLSTKQYDFSVKQDGKWGKGIELTNKNEVIQSFITNKAFNTIDVNFETYDRKNNSDYVFQLIDQKSNILYEEKLEAEAIKNNKYRVFRFDTEIPEGKQEYKIRISSENAINGNAIGVPKYSRQYYDVVPTGRLFVGGQEVVGDLMFKVYNLSEENYMSQLTYILFCIIILGGEYILFEMYLRWLKKNVIR